MSPRKPQGRRAEGGPDMFDRAAEGRLEREAPLAARMRERGAVAVETGWDVATLWPHGWSQRSHTGLWQLYASRPLIEASVLELSRSRHNVTFLERTEVIAALRRNPCRAMSVYARWYARRPPL